MNYEHELHKALVEAFTVESLERMLRYQMGMELESITTAADKESVVATLVRTAVREGWFRGLVNAAYESNPGNERLQYLMRLPQVQKVTQVDMRPFDFDTDTQGLSDRVTELEFLVGSRGLNGLIRSTEALDQRLERIEAALALRNDTPIGPKAAQVLLIVIGIMTTIATLQPAWSLLMMLWGRLNGL